jgi:protein dithiol oxidoreductase (disulfide-forming)
MPTPNRALARWLLGLLLAAAPALLSAQQEGTDFRTLTPARPTENPGKIEVVEFFSYACPHCNEFYPQLHAWLAMQKKDVVLRRVPVSFERPPWMNLARAFYAMQATGVLDKLDGPLFAAIHDKHESLFDEQSLADWVGKNGGNAEQFAAAYTSFGVNNQTVQADAMGTDYGVEGVPTLAVGGKYVALGDSFPEILKNTGALIIKVRAEHAAAAPAGAKKKPPAKS